MAVTKPYYRSCRPYICGSYTNAGKLKYIEHPQYAELPEHYIRPFLILQKDLLKLFDYIEPSEINLDCYSYRIHELLMRACIEVEANCKAILKANRYKKPRKLDMT